MANKQGWHSPYTQIDLEATQCFDVDTREGTGKKLTAQIGAALRFNQKSSEVLDFPAQLS